MYRLIFVIAVALAPFVAGGSIWPSPAAGKEVEPHSRPYQVHLIVSSPRFYIGAGALLSDHWIITSASFVEGAKNITAIIGAHTPKDLQNVTLYHDIMNIKKHPDYEPVTGTNDLAVIEMGLFVYQDGKYAKAVRLPSWSQTRTSFMSSVVETSGYGLDGNNATSALRVVKSHISEASICSAMYGIGKIIDTHLCVFGTTDRGAFDGFVGGPLVVMEADGKPTLIGVHSRSMKEINQPAVYTRVSNYLGWLRSAANIAIRK